MGPQQQQQQQQQQYDSNVPQSSTRGHNLQVVNNNDAERQRYSWAETPSELRPSHQLPSQNQAFVGGGGGGGHEDPPPMPNLILREQQIDEVSVLERQRMEGRQGQIDHQMHPAFAIPPTEESQPSTDPISKEQQQRTTMWPVTEADNRVQFVQPDSKDNKPDRKGEEVNEGIMNASPSINTAYSQKSRFYQPDSSMLLSPHSPGQVMHPFHQPTQEERRWHHGLFDCSPDVTVCCTGLFCPCLLYGRTQYRLSQKSDKKDPTNMLGYHRMNGCCMLMGLCLPLGCKDSFPATRSSSSPKRARICEKGFPD